MSNHKLGLKLALFGLGNMGQIHLQNILKNKAVDADLQKAIEAVKENRLETTTKAVHADDAEDIFSNKKIDAVVIATPTHTHGKLVARALDAGKNILCEKPLDTDVRVVINCYKVAKEKGLILLCAFNRRFDPQIRQLVTNKDRIGKLLTIKMCSRDWPKPSISYLKISNGIFHDCLVHDLDIARWIVGENPETIYVVAHCNDPEIAKLNDVDTVFTTMKFPSGVLMHIESQRECAFGYDQTLEIYGTKGNMVSNNPRKSSIAYNGQQMHDDIFHSFSGRYARAYENEINHFVDLLQKKISTPYVSGDDTVQATLLCQAAEDSWKEGRVIEVKPYITKMLNKYGVDMENISQLNN